MSFGVKLHVHEDTWRAIDAQLARLALVGRERASTLTKGLKAGGKIVKDRVYQRLPKPGYPGDKPDKKALRDTLGVKVIEYPNGVFVLIVGYQYPAGAHGHLREAGHRMVVGGTVAPLPGNKGKRKSAPKADRPMTRGAGRVVGFVEGRWDLKEVAEQTESEVNTRIVEAVTEAIDSAWRG